MEMVVMKNILNLPAGIRIPSVQPNALPFTMKTL
jgi:hypothetical protein